MSHAAAIDALKRAVLLQPAAPDAWLQLAATLTAAERPGDAAMILDAAQSAATASAEMLRARGWALLAVRRDREALESFERAHALEPQDRGARIGRARSLARLRRFAEAFAVIDALLAERPDCARALAVQALLLHLSGRAPEALPIAARAATLDEREALPLVVHGLVLLQRGEASAALELFEAALRRAPGDAAARVGRARSLEALGQFAAALTATQDAARADPENIDVYLLAARLLIHAQRFAEAVECCAQALQRDARNVEALQGRAQCLGALRRPEALAAYDALLAVAPEAPYIAGERFYVQLQSCDWSDYEARRRELSAGVRRGARVDFPGSFLAHSDSPAEQLECARIHAADRLAVDVRVAPRMPAPPGGRIRVAYVSADFHSHPTAFLAAGLFERHDRSRFEVIGVSYGRDDGSDMRRRLERAFDRFLDVRDAADFDIAQRIADLGADIAVDLKGHTLGGRPRIFAFRPAPVQVSFLAYPGTMGVGFLDYLVADRHVVTERSRAHYAEHIIYLPESYQVNDGARAQLPRPGRGAVGLPESGFVFGSFNALYKITPPMFDAWMEILRAVPGSVLWLLDGGPVATGNLRREARARGIDAGRLVFAPGLAPEQHWARCALIDLFLDTLPTNAHTTASDALWAGVPALTLAGETFTSRVATSLLNAVGLPSLSVASRGEYVRMAVQLATDPARLAELRAHLGNVRAHAPLFDTARYCRHLEDAYLEICARQRRGAPPADIRVTPRPSRAAAR
ncbi:MAG TPA: tetratricopeptide repeat protein [Steroidobacteraceae bacterium]|nr:tetratricopeptide repeat protein [Steroidobacteraceae bacterium]